MEHNILCVPQCMVFNATAGLQMVNEISSGFLFPNVNTGCSKNACGVAAL